MLTGRVRLIELGDFVYGEWIIYDSNVPKYHVEALDKDNASNVIINDMLEGGKRIDEIIRLINKSKNSNLSLGKRPLILIKIKSELVELKLDPIPEQLLHNIE